MTSPLYSAAAAKRTRYESLPRASGVTRVHARACNWLQGRRCSCAPGYRAEAFDPITRRRQYRTFPSLEQAKRWRADRKAAIQDGRHRVTAKVTIAQAWDEMYAGIQDGLVVASGGSEYKPAVVRAYESKMRLYVLPKYGRVALTELRLVHVQALVDELTAGGAAPKTVRNAVIPLRVLYRWAIRNEYASLNPCDMVALKSGEVARDRIASTAEALELLAVVPERDRAIWATAFFAGLRRGELMGLEWSNVDLAARVLRVTRSYDPGSQRFVSPKSKKGTREVGIPKLLIPHLAALKLATGRTDELVFGPKGTVPFNAAKLHARAYEAWAAADPPLTPITLHECRHTYASHMIAAGVNIKRISEWMGHSSITITLDRYGHLLPGDRETVLDQLDAYHATAVER